MQDCVNSTSAGPFVVATAFECVFPLRPSNSSLPLSCDTTFSAVYYSEWAAFQVTGFLFTFTFIVITLLEIIGNVRSRVESIRLRRAKTTWAREWWKLSTFKDRATASLFLLLVFNFTRAGDMLGSANVMPFVVTFVLGTGANVCALLVAVLYSISITGAIMRVTRSATTSCSFGKRTNLVISLMALVYSLASIGDAAPCSIGVQFYIWRTAVLGFCTFVLGIATFVFTIPVWRNFFELNRISPLVPNRTSAASVPLPPAGSVGGRAKSSPYYFRWVRRAGNRGPATRAPHQSDIPSGHCDSSSGTSVSLPSSSFLTGSLLSDVTPASGAVPFDPRLAPRREVTPISQSKNLGLKFATPTGGVPHQGVVNSTIATVPIPIKRPAEERFPLAELPPATGNISQLASSVLSRVLISSLFANLVIVIAGIMLILLAFSASGARTAPSFSVIGLEHPIAMWTSTSMIITFWLAPPVATFALSEGRAFREIRLLAGFLRQKVVPNPASPGPNSLGSVRLASGRRLSYASSFKQTAPMSPMHLEQDDTPTPIPQVGRDLTGNYQTSRPADAGLSLAISHKG